MANLQFNDQDDAGGVIYDLVITLTLNDLFMRIT